MGMVSLWKKHRADLASVPGSLLAFLSPVAAISLAHATQFFRKRCFWAHVYLSVCLLLPLCNIFSCRVISTPFERGTEVFEVFVSYEHGGKSRNKQVLWLPAVF